MRIHGGSDPPGSDNRMRGSSRCHLIGLSPERAQFMGRGFIQLRGEDIESTTANISCILILDNPEIDNPGIVVHQKSPISSLEVIVLAISKKNYRT